MKSKSRRYEVLLPVRFNDGSLHAIVEFSIESLPRLERGECWRNRICGFVRAR